MPLASWAHRQKTAIALGTGFGFMAASFAIIAVVAPLTPFSGKLALAPILLLLFFLHTGQMIAIPVARDLVGIIAAEKHVGTYFGFLNSFGGLAVLLSSLMLGWMLDFAHTPQPLAALPWVSLTVLLLASTVILPKIAWAAHRHTGQNQQAHNTDNLQKTT